MITSKMFILGFVFGLVTGLVAGIVIALIIFLLCMACKLNNNTDTKNTKEEEFIHTCEDRF